MNLYWFDYTWFWHSRDWFFQCYHIYIKHIHIGNQFCLFFLFQNILKIWDLICHGMINWVVTFSLQPCTVGARNYMMTSSNGNIFRVTGHLCGEFTGPHKGQWRGPLMFSLISVWINGWENNREAGDLRRYRAHYVVIVMMQEYHLSLRCTPTSGYARGTRIGTVFSGTWNRAENKSIMVTMNATFRSICTSTDVYDLNLPKDH